LASYKLLSYASITDKVIFIAGNTFAIISGAGVIAFIYLIGILFDLFSEIT
jgi:hypothetical protein